MKRFKVVQVYIGGFKIQEIVSSKNGTIILWDGLFETQSKAISHIERRLGIVLTPSQIGSFISQKKAA